MPRENRNNTPSEASASEPPARTLTVALSPAMEVLSPSKAIELLRSTGPQSSIGMPAMDMMPTSSGYLDTTASSASQGNGLYSSTVEAGGQLVLNVELRDTANNPLEDKQLEVRVRLTPNKG